MADLEPEVEGLLASMGAEEACVVLADLRRHGRPATPAEHMAASILVQREIDREAAIQLEGEA